MISQHLHSYCCIHFSVHLFVLWTIFVHHNCSAMMMNEVPSPPSVFEKVLWCLGTLTSVGWRLQVLVLWAGMDATVAHVCLYKGLMYKVVFIHNHHMDRVSKWVSVPFLTLFKTIKTDASEHASEKEIKEYMDHPDKGWQELLGEGMRIKGSRLDWEIEKVLFFLSLGLILSITENADARKNYCLLLFKMGQKKQAYMEWRKYQNSSPWEFPLLVISVQKFKAVLENCLQQNGVFSSVTFLI